ncbi:MAG: hypothetical protein ACREL5_04565 [Gemmatimonadales bacterium]
MPLPRHVDGDNDEVDMLDLPLNAEQRRHLTVVLDRADMALLEAASVGRPPQPARLLRPRTDDFSPDSARDIRAAALRIRKRIADAATDLALEVTPEPVSRWVTAYLSAAVVLLQDCHARSLTAYGDVDPRLSARLDPWLTELENEFTRLRLSVQLDATGLPAASGLR